MSDINKLPKEFRSIVSYMAYERGHNAGEEEVKIIEKSLVDALLPGFVEYEKRIKEEVKKLVDTIWNL